MGERQAISHFIAPLPYAINIFAYLKENKWKDLFALFLDDYLTTGFVNFHANHCLGFAGGSTVNYIHQLGVIVLPVGYQVNWCNLQPNT